MFEGCTSNFLILQSCVRKPLWCARNELSRQPRVITPNNVACATPVVCAQRKCYTSTISAPQSVACATPMLHAQHASKNPIPMLSKHPKLILTLSFHHFSTFIPLAPTNHNHPSSLSSFIFIITTKWQAKEKLRQRHHPQGSMGQHLKEIQLYETLHS
ncbi:hypothetical protein PIB30_096782 [Stylosanthes scabra]|uniref:Uncharacterized protein n=1 Tax=Stylosanthes scabra TaxID=79078 RepID=A0ABU6VVX4_9FABA|nr:hypothetical protein [Stylosanthes scabra]